tara:strand:+ start:2146 stop:2988 length:843 start_codon:yes stop_codon:yes gene_type:complete
MNFITVSAKLVDQPKSLESKIPCSVCNIEIAKPAFGKSYVPVYAQLKIWGKNSSLLAGAPQGQQIIIIDGELIINYNKETQSNEIEIKAKAIAPYQESWTPINNVILSGRTFTDFDPSDPKQRNYRATDSGWIFAEQRLTVQNKALDKYPDIYSFKTVYNNNAEYRRTNYADVIANYLSKKNVPVTIKGSLVREESKNPNTGDVRHYPKILLADTNAISVAKLTPESSQTVKPQEPKAQSTTTVIADNPWKDTDNFPSLAPDPTPIPKVATAPDTSNDPF